MKTQLWTPARSKARYADQYKQKALELWRASGRSAGEVAAELSAAWMVLGQLGLCRENVAVGTEGHGNHEKSHVMQRGAFPSSRREGSAAAFGRRAGSSRVVG
jgi:hypothetical protein